MTDRVFGQSMTDRVFGLATSDVGPDSKHNARKFVSVAEKVSQRITALFGNSAMPRSDSTWTG